MIVPLWAIWWPDWNSYSFLHVLPAVHLFTAEGHKIMSKANSTPNNPINPRSANKNMTCKKAKGFMSTCICRGWGGSLRLTCGRCLCYSCSEGAKRLVNDCGQQWNFAKVHLMCCLCYESKTWKVFGWVTNRDEQRGCSGEGCVEEKLYVWRDQ